MQKRVDIQLLRGIAVLSVMFAHFGGILPGGFLGVDLFFVISGFVITLSFLRLSQQQSSRGWVLKQFWQRRFWRLVPALSTVLATTILFAFFLLPPHEFWDQARMTLWSFFFAGNIGVEIITSGGYFDPAAEQNWLLHLWSLGVEEQFYLVFPLLMAAFIFQAKSQNPLKMTKQLVIGLGFLSLALALVNDFEHLILGTNSIDEITGVSALLGYYSPLTRAWQFSIGIFAALQHIEKPASQTSNPKTALGLVLVLFSLLFTPESWLLPGIATLSPMLGMYILLRWPLWTRLTDHGLAKPLLWLGDRSYSAYLWHWPLWAVLEHLLGASAVSIVLALMLTLLLADITFRWIELPFLWSDRSDLRFPARDKGKQHEKRIRSKLAFILLPFVIVTLITVSDEVLKESGLVLSRQTILRVPAEIDCRLTSCGDDAIDVLLIGDSHAGAISATLDGQLNYRGMRLGAWINAGCLHLLNDLFENEKSGCNFDEDAVTQLLDSSSLDAAVIFGYTVGRFTSTNSGGDQEIGLIDRRSGERVTNESGPDAYSELINDTVSMFVQRNIPVVIVTGVPDFDLRPEEVNASGDEATMAERLLPSRVGKVGQTILKTDYLERHSAFVQIDEDLAAQNDLVSVVNGWDVLCEPAQCSQLTLESEFIFSDQDHLGEFGARVLSTRIAELIGSRKG